MDALLDKIVSAISETFEGEILQSGMEYDFAVVWLNHEKIVPIIRQLKEHPKTKFHFLTTLCGIHYPDRNQIAIMYQLHNMFSNERVRLKVFLSADNPVVQSLVPVFPGANWMERETYDFYGVHFEGHPNLKRILNVEEMIMFPLRKEYPLEDQVRHDKDDTMFGREAHGN